jgi:ABC-2 type transport system ATP-binding protein
MTDYQLQGIDVTKRFANHIALDKVSISVPRGSIYGLLGPNGAGKTTLIRIINNITAPDEGQIYFSDSKLSSEHISYIGYLPEERGLYKKMKVGEQALYLAQLKGLTKKDALIKLKYWFERFEIQEWWGRKVEELSKGMQQKVQFMITILHEPKLLIFDEPFSGFDPINVNILKDEIFNLRSKGATIIFSTHNMASVEELCDDIALINNGKVILEGGLKQIKNTYKSNTYEIEFSDNLSSTSKVLESFEVLNEFKIIDEIKVDGLIRAKVKINSDTSPNKLLYELYKLCELYKLTFHSFREILPTMNEIFISMVEADKKNGQMN